MNTEYVHETVRVPEQFLAWIYYQSENNITEVPLHWHRSMELSYILKGQVSYEVNGRRFIAREQDIVLVNSSDVHGCTTNYEGESEMICILFPYDFLKMNMPDFNDYRYEIRRGTEAYDYIREAFEEIHPIFRDRAQNPLYQIKLNGFFFSILYMIFKECKVPKQVPGSIISQKHLERCTEILDYIDAHYMENLSLETLADQFSMSREHMSRTFKNCMATTFKKHLTSIRLHHAYQDLLTSDLPITQIALDNGFSDARAFTSAFRSYYNETPQKYRLENRDPDYSHVKARYLQTQQWMGWPRP